VNCLPPRAWHAVIPSFIQLEVLLPRSQVFHWFLSCHKYIPPPSTLFPFDPFHIVIPSVSMSSNLSSSFRFLDQNDLHISQLCYVNCVHRPSLHLGLISLIYLVNRTAYEGPNFAVVLAVCYSIPHKLKCSPQRHLVAKRKSGTEKVHFSKVTVSSTPAYFQSRRGLWVLLRWRTVNSRCRVCCFCNAAGHQSTFSLYSVLFTRLNTHFHISSV
jgi:hypothetical protein